MNYVINHITHDKIVLLYPTFMRVLSLRNDTKVIYHDTQVNDSNNITSSMNESRCHEEVLLE